MNKFILLVLFAFSFNNAQSAQTGRLFIVDASWENEPKPFHICLYDKGAVDCEDFMVYGRDVYIRTIKPVKSNYQTNAGIKPMRATPKFGCTMMSNDYCAFKATHDKFAYIKLE
jgi:hypothetical protein